MTNPVVHIVGAGLAGSEAAWQCVRQGIQVVLHEMRPTKSTEAHKTGRMAELVCSNSLKSTSESSAPGQLKFEMKAMDSLILSAAEKAAVPAGQALAVDRELFSGEIESRLQASGLFIRMDEEITELPSEAELIARNEIWIVATGPLTAAPLSAFLQSLFGNPENLYFYDAIAPTIAAESINMDEVFWGDRYGEGDGDYLNLPLNQAQYDAFVREVAAAEKMPMHEFESAKYFQGCMPIEVMIERGPETPRFGPMKPVGFIDPKTGEQPWALVQLRKENKSGTMLSMVGFQTKMKWPEQKRVFGMLPGLAEAEFYRYGSIHRNTYVNSPLVLSPNLTLKANKRVLLAGQITGVEGYTESASIGLIAGRVAAGIIRGKEFKLPPVDSMIGGLLNYVTLGPPGEFQPMNANMGLLPRVKKQRSLRKKNERHELQCLNARNLFSSYTQELAP